MNYVATYAAVRFLATNDFLLKVIEIRPYNKKREAADLNYESRHFTNVFKEQ